MEELISIVVPSHNSGKYLKTCLDSLINQTYKNIEIIVVENGSTDNSLNILKEYKNIEIIKLKQANLGLARNTGIEKSKGKYIALIDSDDYIEKTFIEKLYNSIKTNNSDLSICNIKEIEEKTKKETIRKEYPNELIDSNKIKSNLINFSYGPCNKLYKKEIIIKNNIKFAENLKYEDIPFVLKYLINSKKISKVDEELYIYNIHNNSEQTTVDKSIFDILDIMNISKRYVNNYYLEDLYVKVLTTYSLKTRYLNNKKLRNDFIDKSYNELNNNFPEWKKCKYIKSTNILKRIIIKNKKLVKIYASIYSRRISKD